MEIYRRLGDSVAVLELHVEAKEWAQAFNLVRTQPQHKSLVYVPYAHWLAENDKFVQAQKGNQQLWVRWLFIPALFSAFHMAGKLEDAFKVLDELTENAVDEGRFHDAGYYYWILSRQYLDLAKDRYGDYYYPNRIARI